MFSFQHIVHVLKPVQGGFRCRHEGEGVEDLKLWRPAIINHLYWTAASTPKGDSDVMEANWQSEVNHVQDIINMTYLHFPAAHFHLWREKH